LITFGISNEDQEIDYHAVHCPRVYCVKCVTIKTRKTIILPVLYECVNLDLTSIK